VRSSRRCDDGLIRAGVFLIAVCTIVGARTARAQTAAGTVSSASGGVGIARGGATLPATPGTPVKQGDKIVSGVEGEAVIILSDGSQLELQPSTTITLDQYTAGGATPTRVSLASGILRSAVHRTSDTPANYQVRTPNAIVTARGTDFYTSYGDKSPQLGNLPGVSHYTEVAVLEGTVDLAQAAAPDRGVEVAQGTTGTVAGDQYPDRHHRIFPPPPCECDRNCDRDFDRDRDHDRNGECHRDCRRDHGGEGNCHNRPTPVPTPTCSSAPVSVDQCKDGGWRQFACFKNQGQCVSFVRHEEHGK
jgi:FecR protein